MTTTVKSKKGKSIPRDHFLLSSLKEPKRAIGYLEAAIEENYPGVFTLAICNVIKANHDLPFIAYFVVCSYSHYLSKLSMFERLDGLESIDF